MIKVVIIGSGSVAQHLIVAFRNAQKQANTVDLIQVFSRKKEKLWHLIDSSKVINEYDELLDADLYIIAVSDNSILEVTENLTFKNRLVVHTSGSFPIDELNDITEIWVDAALRLDERNLKVMDRLVRAQNSKVNADVLHINEKQSA